jgi:hypothetical protein
VHDVAESLDLHELRDLDGARPADLEQVVAREVDKHEVLCLLLVVGEQLLSEFEVALWRLAPRPGPCDRVHVDPLLLHLDERFWARTDD